LSKSEKLFTERLAYHVSQGLSGRAVYEALAADSTLPNYFTSIEAGAIVGLGPVAMTKRRARRAPPSYIAHSHRSVLYPRHSLCLWLADIFVDRGAA
jgi:hypothetical protein